MKSLFPTFKRFKVNLTSPVKSLCGVKSSSLTATYRTASSSSVQYARHLDACACTCLTTPSNHQQHQQQQQQQHRVVSAAHFKPRTHYTRHFDVATETLRLLTNFASPVQNQTCCWFQTLICYLYAPSNSRVDKFIFQDTFSFTEVNLKSKRSLKSHPATHTHLFTTQSHPFFAGFTTTENIPYTGR